MHKFEVCGFEHLHRHSDYSLLDGFAKVAEYAEYSKKVNQKFLCISDHGVMGSVPQVISEAEKHSLHPLFAVELYVNNMQPFTEKREESTKFKSELDEAQRKLFDRSHHLLAMAYTDKGFQNLVRLTSWGWIHGFYKRPRVTHEILKKYKEGIVFSSCCAVSEIAYTFFNYGKDAGFDMVRHYMDMFYPNFYLELMMIDFKPQKPYDQFIIEASQKFNLPVILTNDCHYLLPEHSHNQRVMLLMQTGKTLADLELMIAKGETDMFELQDSNLWMKSEDELNLKWQQDYSEIIDYDLFKKAKSNTVDLANKAKGVKLDRSIKLPKIPDANEKLIEEIQKGIRKRKIQLTSKYAKQIQEELELVVRKDFASYFLIQKEMIDEAKRVGPSILGFGNGSEVVGPGRGCVTAKTRVVLHDGSTKFASDIVVGDKVITRNGSVKEVKKVFVYDINEPLVKINCYYGDEDGVTLTLDHEILSTISENLSWIQAKDITEDHWVFVPKVKNIKFNWLAMMIEDSWDLTVYLKDSDRNIADKNRFMLWSKRIPSSIEKEDKQWVMKFPKNNEHDIFRETKDGLLLKVKSIENIEAHSTKVYDFEIEENHNYLTSSFLIHNSAVGFLICYLLGITDVDPLKHDLLSTRFLSPARGGRSIKLKFSKEPI